MYRRYSQRNDDSLSLTQMKRNRIKDIVILLLAAAVIVMAVFMIPAIREQNEERETYIRRFQVEAEEASRQTNSLSRTAGADGHARARQRLAGRAEGERRRNTRTAIWM